MNNIIKKYIGKSSLMMAFALMATGTAMISCSDETLSNINTDKTKVSELDPNAQLTTALLQTYGDFSLMDTYRNYITGFPQYFAGGWNVTNYAGSNFREDDMTRRVWDRYYEVSIKNLVDAIHNSADKANLNAALRIHRVYLTAVLADTYGDVHIRPLVVLTLSGGEKVFCGVANAVQFFEPQLGVLLLIISGFEEQCRDLLKAFLLGLGCKIGVFVARLGLAGKCGHQIFFGLSSCVFRFFHGRCSFQLLLLIL